RNQIGLSLGEGRNRLNRPFVLAALLCYSGKIMSHRKKLLAFVMLLVCVGCSAQTNALLDPQSSAMNQTAPATFKVLFTTSKGDFTVDVTRDWAPKGADRFYNLAKNGFFTDVRFFRVIRNPQPFMAQFGISGDPNVAAKWEEARIEDDPVKQ